MPRRDARALAGGNITGGPEKGERRECGRGGGGGNTRIVSFPFKDTFVALDANTFLVFLLFMAALA